MLEYFRPDIYVDRITDIDVDALINEGFEALMLDLDNTLLPWKSSDLPETSGEWVRGAMSKGLKVCIVSNTHYPRRLNAIASDLGVDSISQALKPRPHGFQRAAKMLGVRAENTVVVGDQILTDILGGNAWCARTILVKPMDSKEFVGTKVSRLVEKVILALLSRQARTGTNFPEDKSENQDTK